MPTITITYESDVFGAAVDALVAVAISGGERISLDRAAADDAPPWGDESTPATPAPPAKRTGRYGDGVERGGGYGSRRDGRADTQPPTDAQGRTLCADCGEQYHDPQYKRCYECSQSKYAGWVDCAECGGANRHDPKYQRCYQCAKARKAYANAPDDGYTDGGYTDGGYTDGGGSGYGGGGYAA